MPKLLINLTEDQAQFLSDRADRFSGKSGVVRDLIDSARLGVDMPATLAERPAAEGRGASTSKTSTKKNTITSVLKSIPLSLQVHDDLIRAFWKTKAGAKTDASWTLLMKELAKIQDKYGDRVVRDQLELAAASRWKGVSLRNYEQFGLGAQRAQHGQKSIDQLAAEMDAMPRLW